MNQPSSVTKKTLPQVTRAQTSSSLRVLIVDADPTTSELLTNLELDLVQQTVQVRSLKQATKALDRDAYDLVLIDAQENVDEALSLAKQIHDQHLDTDSLLLGSTLSTEQTIRAMRAGVCDILSRPLDQTALTNRFKLVSAQQQAQRQQHNHIQKLQQTCDKLTQAHADVTRQVDVLCNDLVTAYHDLATQMQQTVETHDFVTYVGDKLNLEHLLRRTLEYMLEKLGPTNTALFLPSVGDEYALGGYVNCDGSREAADMILHHLADVVAPRMADRTELLHLTDNQTLTDWIGDDAAYLEDNHVIAFACQHEDETLAVMILFRDQSDPYTQEAIQTCQAVASLLGERLARIIRIHHRHLPDAPGSSENPDGESPAFGF